MIPSGQPATGEEENATVVFLTSEKDLEMPTQAIPTEDFCLEIIISQPRRTVG